MINIELANLIVGIIFGLPPLIAFLASRRNRFYFLLEDATIARKNLFDNINDIHIYYKDRRIEKSILLIKGLIISLNKSDIKKDEIDENLTLKLNDPESCWLSYKIIAQEYGITLLPKTDSNKMTFFSNIIKDKDYVYFEALALIANKSHSFSFFHRIANIDKKIIVFRAWSLASNFIFTLLSLLGFLAFAWLSNDTFNKKVYSFDLKPKLITENKILDVDSLKNINRQPWSELQEKITEIKYQMRVEKDTTKRRQLFFEYRKLDSLADINISNWHTLPREIDDPIDELIDSISRNNNHFTMLFFDNNRRFKINENTYVSYEYKSSYIEYIPFIFSFIPFISFWINLFKSIKLIKVHRFYKKIKKEAV